MDKILKKEDYVWRTITVLAVVGILLAVYLFASYLTAAESTICSVSDKVNCDAVITGNLAEIWGIPVSLIGLIGYAIITIASILKLKKTTLGTTIFGMLFCLRLSILEIFVEKVYCPVCWLCQIVMLLVFLLAVKLSLKKTNEKAQ